MEPLRQAAFVSVARACGFAGLAIFCVMAGLSFEPVLATRIGGALTLAVVLALLLKCFYLRYQDHRKTELWLILDKRYRPPEAYAARVSREILRETYLRFAQSAAAVSVLLLTLSVLLAASGFSGLGARTWESDLSARESLAPSQLPDGRPRRGDAS